MNDKDVEKLISQEIESSLPDSGLSFDDLSSKIDFFVYKKKKKPFYRRPWFAVSSLALVVVAIAGTVAVIKFGGARYYETGYSFCDGEYTFSKIVKKSGETDLQLPSEGDRFVVGDQPVGTVFFKLSKETSNYDGYLSVIGVAENYPMTTKSIRPGSINLSMTWNNVDYSARITAMKYEPVIYFEIKSPSFSYLSVYQK